MSAIAGLLTLDGGPIDSIDLDRMAEPLARRFPGGTRNWSDDRVGLVQAYADAAAEGPRPHIGTLNSADLRIAFAGRIDDRGRLITRLAAARPGLGPLTRDGSLLLAAYRVWGEGCVERVLGDFAFAVWDGPNNRLYCGRDRFGVRPLYYVLDGTRLAFGSDMESLLRLPGVPHAFDDSALADFLLFGYDRDPAGTPYRTIRQLPPAHTLTCEGPRVRVRRYWRLGPQAPISYRCPEDHVERFRELFGAAVSDRVREPRVGVLLSGGVDSTAVAATAARDRRLADGPGSLRGYTVTAEVLCPRDEEGRYAALAATRQGIVHTLHRMDAVVPFERWGQVSPPNLAPVYAPFYASHRDLLQCVEVDGVRVLLAGEGGDPSCLTAVDYVRTLLRRLAWGRLLRESWGAWRIKGTLRGLGWRRLLRRSGDLEGAPPALPLWLDPGLVSRLGLEERWRDYYRPPAATVLPEQAALDDLADVAWYETRFRQDEGCWTPVELRYPFFDVRVVEFLLAIPRYLCRDKWILRAAMSDRLPPEVLARPKAPYPCDLLRSWIKGLDPERVRSRSLDHLAGYVEPQRYKAALMDAKEGSSEPSHWGSIGLLTPIALGGWLGNARQWQSGTASASKQ